MKENAGRRFVTITLWCIFMSLMGCAKHGDREAVEIQTIIRILGEKYDVHAGDCVYIGDTDFIILVDYFQENGRGISPDLLRETVTLLDNPLYNRSAAIGNMAYLYRNGPDQPPRFLDCIYTMDDHDAFLAELQRCK